MKNKFPYLGISKTVTEEMCDLNGHMNVTFYTKIFEEGSYEMFNQLGMGFDYINSGFSTFTLEQNLRYCLLYTSPSPRDISGSRMPSSA